MTEEDKLIRTIDEALRRHTIKVRGIMRQVRLHIRHKEYYLAACQMTELTTTQATVSMELRSILVKQGFIESEI